MKRVGQKLRDALDLEIGRRKIEGLSQHSLRAMRDAADSLCLSADPHERASAADLTPAQVVEWIDAMRQRGLSPTTLLVRYRYLATLMRGLVSAGVIPVSPMKDLRAPRAVS
jgi:site-specific recombinase XerC